METLNFEGWLRKQLDPYDTTSAAAADGATANVDESTTNGLDIDSEIGKYDVAVVLTGSNDLKVHRPTLHVPPTTQG